MVYGYMKTTEYTRFNFRKLQISISIHKKGLPYWWNKGIKKQPKKTKLIYKTKEKKNNKQKRENIKIKKSNFSSKKGLPYWWYTGIRRLLKYTNSILENFIYQFKLTKRGFHIDGIQVYKDYRVYKIQF